MKLCAIETKELEDKLLTRFADNQNDELLEDLSDYVINSQKEIERLNNIINEIVNIYESKDTTEDVYFALEELFEKENIRKYGGIFNE